MWELCTLFAFLSEETAHKKVILEPISGTKEDDARLWASGTLSDTSLDRDSVGASEDKNPDDFAAMDSTLDGMVACRCLLEAKLGDDVGALRRSDVLPPRLPLSLLHAPHETAQTIGVCRRTSSLRMTIA